MTDEQPETTSYDPNAAAGNAPAALGGEQPTPDEQTEAQQDPRAARADDADTGE